MGSKDDAPANMKKKIELTDVAVYFFVATLVGFALLLFVLICLFCFITWEGFGWAIIFSALISYASYAGLERVTNCRTDKVDGFIFKPKKLPKFTMIIILVGLSLYLTDVWSSRINDPKINENLSLVLSIFNIDWGKDLASSGYYRLHRFGYLVTALIFFSAIQQAYALFRDRNDYIEVDKNFLFFRDNNDSGKFSLTGITEFIFSPKEAAYGDIKFVYAQGDHFTVPVSKMNFGNRERDDLLRALQDKLGLTYIDGRTETDKKATT